MRDMLLFCGALSDTNMISVYGGNHYIVGKKYGNIKRIGRYYRLFHRYYF